MTALLCLRFLHHHHILCPRDRYVSYTIVAIRFGQNITFLSSNRYGIPHISQKSILGPTISQWHQWGLRGQTWTLISIVLHAHGKNHMTDLTLLLRAQAGHAAVARASCIGLRTLLSIHSHKWIARELRLQLSGHSKQLRVSVPSSV